MTIFRISFVRISEIEMKTKKGKDMTCEEVLEWLAAHANPEFREGMVRFGIDARLAVGVRVVDLRRLALKIGRNHALALELYRRPVHEGRILASMIADPALFRPEEMDAWVAEFRSWDLCDQCCINLFRYTSYAYGKVREYAASDEEFTRRAGFALLATLAVGDKRASDDDFRAFLPLIERGAEDSRVRIGKAVNWALRQIGKTAYILENPEITKRYAPLIVPCYPPEGFVPGYIVSTDIAEEKLFPDTAEGAAARRIGRDAVRELTLERIIARIK